MQACKIFAPVLFVLIIIRLPEYLYIIILFGVFPLWACRFCHFLLSVEYSQYTLLEVIFSKLILRSKIVYTVAFLSVIYCLVVLSYCACLEVIIFFVKYGMVYEMTMRLFLSSCVIFTYNWCPRLIIQQISL